MPKKRKFHVKIGDTVRIISGFHKNETGEIIQSEIITCTVQCSKDHSHNKPSQQTP